MEKDIDIDGVRIHYDETGNPYGAAVVLMHGWGCNHTTVRSIAATLEDGMHVYNIDLPGHGQSQEPPTAWGTADFARLIERFIDILRIENPALIGHSFGGRVSIQIASEKGIEKMVLVDAAGIKPRRPLKYYLKVYSFKTAKHLLPIILGKKGGTRVIEKMRKNAGSADYRNSSPMMRSVMSRCVNEDLKHLMPSIKASTLLIWGDDDTATPLSDAKTMENLIPDAGLANFAGCGHYSFLDDPGRFRATLQVFFKKELEEGKGKSTAMTAMQ